MTCDHCSKLRKSEWLGRLAAEAFTADHVRFVTYTYDDDHLPSDKKIDRRHIKECYAVRRRRYEFRHFTVGEYGEINGRPHFHSLQFYYGEPPMEPLNVNCRTYGWAKGNAQYELPKSIASCASYVYAYLDKGGEAMKPSPKMGHQYLVRFAQMQARNRRFLTGPHGIQYYVPGVRTREGALWRYHLPCWHSYATDMAEAYLDTWAECHDDPPRDELRGIAYG